jgi:hypothetical protein
MLGETDPEDFLSSIQQKLDLSLETAGEIVKDINADIFFPIRESLEELNNGGVSKYSSPAPLVEHFSPRGQVSTQNIQKQEIPLQNPNNNAIIVDKEVTDNENRSDRKIFDEKMGKLFRLPKEQVDLGNSGGANDQAHKDPYREGTF